MISKSGEKKISSLFLGGEMWPVKERKKRAFLFFQALAVADAYFLYLAGVVISLVLRCCSPPD
jgi:hypothetical protein